MDVREEFKKLTQIPDFESQVEDKALLETEKMSVLQINVGRLCNLACKHCHMEAGPNRTEVMERDVMEACLKIYTEWGFDTIDITGGAPEINPNFRWFVKEAVKICKNVMVRSNLTIMLEDGYKDLPEFYAENKVTIICSLPHYRAKNSDKQRGEGTFEKSIEVLKKLNMLGYGKDPELVLNMVFNPGGAFFPPEQAAMEKEYKEHLGSEYGIVFNNLFTITNNPIGRFGSFLISSGNMEGYLTKLFNAFNTGALPGMMCRSQLSVGWDGKLYDCDFNQAVDMPISSGENIKDLPGKPYEKRKICFDKHCYACTAGQGSSCGGSTA
ncbi:MAG: radical SAM/Cys-rich domain protein [Dorea sp.]|jgi:radical SAM/Cys-rich protein|nr:radical SAM/Cys-rich domain protein [Dorea sp.]